MRMQKTVGPEMRPLPSKVTQEQENKIFARLVKKYGAYVLEEKIQRLDSARRYYRRYPFDAWQKRASMEAIDIKHPSNPLKELIADETRNEFLEGLTDRERWVAEKAEEGYKPGDMAVMRGKASSGADRWIKWSVRRKMERKLSSVTDH